METTNKKQTGHTILTYRVRLYDRHFTWLEATKELYERVVEHFFHVLCEEEELLQQSNFLLLRALEEKCIGTKEMKAAGRFPEYPLNDFPKVPLYFRRSAINTAIDLARKNAGMLHPNMVLYKGMYQNFTNKTIDIKLFNGEKWVWVTYPFTGREFLAEAERMSPMLVIEKTTAWLEVPLSFEVEDVRTIKERMQTEERICALSFPDNDTLAVAVILDREGNEQEHRFFRGGKQKEEQRKRILARIRESEQSRSLEVRKQKRAEEQAKEKLEKTIEEPVEKLAKELTEKQIGEPLEQSAEQLLETQVAESTRKQSEKQIGESLEKQKEKKVIEAAVLQKENATLYADLRNLNKHYAHSVSRQILDYCLEQNIKVVVVPNYENVIDFRDKKFLKTDAYRWLGRSIIKNLKYKAFSKGIVVASIRPYHISDCCSVCGAKIRKYNEGHIAGHQYFGGKLFLCPNGHSGNTARNTANNVGKSFLTYYKR